MYIHEVKLDTNDSFFAQKLPHLPDTVSVFYSNIHVCIIKNVALKILPFLGLLAVF